MTESLSGASAGQWYVLVEANRSEVWRLAEKVHVEGGREEALRRAEEMSLSYDRSFHAPDGYGRTVFRTSESSWLVELTESHWSERFNELFTSSAHFRISVGELTFVRETPPVEPPPAKKGRLRRAVGLE